MIALTQEKREELIEKALLKREMLVPNGLNAMLNEISLASLTADIFAHVDGSGLNFYRHPSPTIEHALEQGDQVTPLFIAPPVPEIKRPDLLDIPDGLDLASAMAAINWYEMETKRLNGWGE